MRSLNIDYDKQYGIKDIVIGDIWLVGYKYHEKGNFNKVRPALVTDYDDNTEKIKVKMITTKEKTLNRQNIEIPFYISKEKRKSYLANRYEWLSNYDFIRRLKSVEEIRKYKLHEIE